MSQKKEISEIHENSLSQLLISSHSIGGIRDESDFDTVKFHSLKTLKFARDLIRDINGTDEEKIKLLDKVLIDLNKFRFKKRVEDKYDGGKEF